MTKGAVFFLAVCFWCAPHLAHSRELSVVSIPSASDIIGSVGGAVSKGAERLRGAASGCGIDKTCVHIRNKCYEEIYVAIRYKRSDSIGWRSEGWWKLNPSQKAYIVDIFSSGSRYVLFHATSDSGKKWGSSHSFRFKGKTYKANQADTGSNHNTYTYSFSCD